MDGKRSPESLGIYNEGDAIAQLKRRAYLGALLSYPRRVLPFNLAVRVGVISGIFFDFDALEERNKDEVIQSETAQKYMHHDQKKSPRACGRLCRILFIVPWMRGDSGFLLHRCIVHEQRGAAFSGVVSSGRNPPIREAILRIRM